jgi:proteasome lid subunit RPN8/RPN11
MILTENSAEHIMFDDAVKAFPDECCGFMFGSENAEGERVVMKALPVYNSAVENRRRRFVIAPKDYMNAERFAEENNLQFLGIYHSHPNHPAVPSEHDRIAAQPWFSYVIISVNAEGVHHVRSWLLNENFQFDEERYNGQLINSIK